MKMLFVCLKVILDRKLEEFDLLLLCPKMVECKLRKEVL